MPTLEDTNDIGFVAARVTGGTGIEPGIYFNLQLGGITGHLDFAFETGVLLKPEECVKVAGAVVRAMSVTRTTPRIPADRANTVPVLVTVVLWVQRP